MPKKKNFNQLREEVISDPRRAARVEEFLSLAWADYCWRSGWQTRYNRNKGHRPIEVYNAERAARHGTVSMYKNGCRCDGCRLASADAKRAWRQRNLEASRAYDREYQKRRRRQT